MDQPVILIQSGWQDSGPTHWQSLWLKKFPNTVKVIQKDWMNPRKDEWTDVLNEYIKKYTYREIILVGHSLGCLAIAYWSQEYAKRKTAKIKGALLVAPGDSEGENLMRKIAET